jgi:hypothetical protein
VTDELELLERQGWDALSGPTGAAFYEELMADDAVMVFPGAVLDKPSAIAAIATAPPWRSYDLTGIRVIRYSDHVGVVVYRATAERTPDTAYVAWMSSVYARRNGRWALLLHQQTPDPA